ncbi:type II secretion system F family protein [Nocardiopsis rhodophaea]|uniref:type II secretion system F family protein n=1 Tax=Nocardiopsis rhodophaea TaxID=280238 RepID=UPI0031DBFF88
MPYPLEAPESLPGWAAALLLLGAVGYVFVQALPSSAAARLRALRRATARPPERIPGQPALRDDGLGERTRRWPCAEMRNSGRSLLHRLTGRELARRRRAVVELTRSFAAELRAGRTPAAAVESAIAEAEPPVAAELTPVTAAARSGADLAPALEAAAVLPGTAGLRYLAACWRVTAGTGAGLADVVDRLSESLMREEELREELAAHLAGPRTTALLLSVLPVAGLAMAALLGGGPLAFLFGTPLGLACLTAGAALDALGLYWTNRMVRRASASFGPGAGR